MDAIRKAIEALEAAGQFIRNGVEFGYIRMPDTDCPDTAHKTPGQIDAALSALKALEAGSMKLNDTYGVPPSPEPDSIDRAMAYEAAERVKFERWAASKGFNIDRDPDDPKYRDYHRATTRWAWDAWIERAIQADAHGVNAPANWRDLVGEPRPITPPAGWCINCGVTHEGPHPVAPIDGVLAHSNEQKGGA